MSSTADELIQRAIDMVGRDDPEDHRLVPTQHPAALQDRAPMLTTVLRSDELQTLARQYEADDQRAVEAHGEFRRAAGQLNAAVLLAAVLGALMLTIGVWTPQISGNVALTRVADGLLLALGVASLGVAAFAAMRLHQLNVGDLAGAWLRLRAEAEQARLDYFARTVACRPRSAPEAGPGAVPLALLKLEYVRRFQLGLQRAYFATRGRRHETDARRTLGWGALAVGLSSVAASSGGVLGATNRPWLSLAALGTVAAALTSFAAAREAMNQDRTRAERFRNTRAALDRIALKLEEVRTAVAEGSSEALEAFVATLHEQLALEHRQFLVGGDSIRAALTNLEATLQDTRRGGTVAPSVEGKRE